MVGVMEVDNAWFKSSFSLKTLFWWSSSSPSTQRRGEFDNLIQAPEKRFIIRFFFFSSIEGLLLRQYFETPYLHAVSRISRIIPFEKIRYFL